MHFNLLFRDKASPIANEDLMYYPRKRMHNGTESNINKSSTICKLLDGVHSNHINYITEDHKVRQPFVVRLRPEFYAISRRKSMIRNRDNRIHILPKACNGKEAYIRMTTKTKSLEDSFFPSRWPSLAKRPKR